MYISRHPTLPELKPLPIGIEISQDKAALIRLNSGRATGRFMGLPGMETSMSEMVSEATPNQVTEYCTHCGKDTTHAVRLEVQASGEAKYSREPHRIAQCHLCGHTRTDRVGG